MIRSKLQNMVFEDAYARLLREDRNRACDISFYDEYAIPTDQQIKEDGYEGAVEIVYQQLVALGQTV